MNIKFLQFKKKLPQKHTNIFICFKQGNRIDYELPTSPTLKNDSQRILQIPSGINDIESLESENYTCHESFETHSDSVVSIQFWLEGVGLCVTGAFGLIGNLITFQVLKKQVWGHIFDIHITYTVGFFLNLKNVFLNSFFYRDPAQVSTNF